ncbi:S8 family peptidase [Actinophytocola gossypii]|uniref:S8 family serine peptidase n=1 Tax=Actinophytocola gossypii TaxID=2812003 RepID=A0ABT2JEL6_9PSEU|nr:S8 family serine peptidase [Actinophytocola gossypii]MCT2586319.1 S8 family serine peptidase [Actinophytocola gossypii]
MSVRLTAVVVAALVAGGIVALPAAAAPPPGESVALVTGDRVVLDADGSVVDIEPAPGREEVPFRTFRTDGHTHVVPDDAVRLLAADRLDPRLFDVTLLREPHYAARDTLPLIVDGRVSGATVTRRLPGLTAVDVDRDGDDWRALTTAGTVWLDGHRRASLDESVPRIGAPAAWEAGLTGDGVTVAVLDTGVDQNHPDLAGRELAEANFSEAPDNVDRYGHGTHVASTIAGVGEPYRGVAPGVRLLDGKVLDDSGWGSDSALIAGMHWAAEQGARIVNLSLGVEDTPGVDPVEATVDALSAEHGILFVAAAGNSYRPRTIGSPASADSALAVSAVDADGAVADFASRGPGLDNVVKPEITAPGVAITAAVPGGHDTLSGTSMATPHVTGAAALLAERHPEWTGQRLRAALTGSAVPTSAASVFEQGSGRVDVPAALAASVHATPATLDFGVVRYPHDEPVTRTLTYHNDGPADVSLDLAVDATGLSLGADRVLVPAGGQASVDVTAAPGSTSTTVTAMSGAVSVRTPVGVVWEPESYDLTINVIGLDGLPADDYDVLRMGFGEDGFEFLYDPDGTITTRVPAGPAPLKATVRGPGSTRDHLVNLLGLTVTEDTTVTLDARTAQPVEITLPEEASPDGFDVGYAVYRPDLAWNYHSVLYPGPATVAVAHAGPVVPGDRVTTWLSGGWGDGRYHLAWFRHGGSHTGLRETVRQKDLATVRTRLVAHAPGATGSVLVLPAPVGGLNRVFPASLTMGAPSEDFDLPAEFVTRVNREAAWTTALRQDTPDGGATSARSPERWFRPGTHRQVLGHPVLGPALPPTPYRAPGASRTGDWIEVDVPLFGDAAGNAGYSTHDSARTALYRDDVLIGERPVPGTGSFEVPPEPGTYRLTTSASRSGFALSTRVSAAWTFRSAHVPGGDWRRVPLSVIGFRPAVSESGEAPVGRFAVPVVVTGPSGEPVRPRRLTVEVSYDDGATWRTVPVTGHQVARLHHPADAESVSLRARAVNRDGTTVEQTVVRAYLLG